MSIRLSHVKRDQGPTVKNTRPTYGFVYYRIFPFTSKYTLVSIGILVYALIVLILTDKLEQFDK